MNWLIGSKQAEAKRWIAQLADVTQRERAGQELIRLGSEAVSPLIEAFKTGMESTSVLSAVSRSHPFRDPGLRKA